MITYIALQQVTEAVVICLVLEETGKLRPHLISKLLGQLHSMHALCCVNVRRGHDVILHTVMGIPLDFLHRQHRLIVE